MGINISFLLHVEVRLPVYHHTEAHTAIPWTLCDTYLAHPSPSMVESAKTLSPSHHSPRRDGSARRNWKSISRPQDVPGKKWKDAGHRWCFFLSHIPIGGRGLGRERSIWGLNSWLSRHDRGTRAGFLGCGWSWVPGPNINCLLINFFPGLNCLGLMNGRVWGSPA